MTQAFNLSQLANNLNSSGQLDATDGLVNAVPIVNGGTGAATASSARGNLGLTIGTNVPSPTGTGASGTWPISISGNAATASNGGVTSVNGATGAVTVSSNPGTVTSVATGNGLQGGTITSSGTLSIAAPGANTVGSYAMVSMTRSSGSATITFGSNYSAGAGTDQVTAATLLGNPGSPAQTQTVNQLSGTWRWMSSNVTYGPASCPGYVQIIGMAVRVA